MTEKDKLSRRKLNIYFALGVVVLAALAAVGVIHFKNVVTEPSGNDVWGHMYKSEYLYKALKRGQILCMTRHGITESSYTGTGRLFHII